MKPLILILWLLLPVGAVAYHFGPGQERARLDVAKDFLAQAAERVAEAERCAAEEGDASAAPLWAAADEAYEAALRALPEERVEERRAVRLERAKAQMYLSRLPEANQDLALLVEELASDASARTDLLAEARSAYASSQYYMTWLLRLEGAGREDWEPEIEIARQTYKLLAEDAKARGDEVALGRHQADLEAAIKLARMELTELQGLPLPSV